MTRPGVEILSRAEPLPRSAPTDTGPWFVSGATGIGPTTPTLVRSLTDYTNTFGDRQGGAVLYDAIETFFREGGSQAWVIAAPTTPSLMAAGVSYTGEELDAMTRSELDDVAALAGLSPADYATKADVQDAIESALAPTQNIVTPAALVALLDAFSSDYGPGQVSVPGVTTVVDQVGVLAHAAAHNRVALLDAPDGDASSLQAAAASLRADTNARYGALFAPSAIIPGVAGGTSRTVGYSAVEAGIIARNDASLNANQAAAGDWGQATFAQDLVARYTDAEYTSLNDAGVAMAKLVYNGVRTYGYRSLVDPNGASGQWRDFGWCRLNMEIVAQAGVIGEHYVFSQIDGRGRTIAQFGGDLRAMLVPMYEAGALFGATPEEAFQVDVGSAVNTPATIANGELHAVIEVRMSPFAEWVVIEIVKVSTLQAIAA